MTLARLEFFLSADGKARDYQYMPADDGETYMTEVSGVRIGVIGGLMILTGRYDPDQGWLGFMHGAIITTPPPSEEEIEQTERWRRIAPLQLERDRPRHQAEIQKKLAAPINVGWYSKLYDYRDRRQHVLPFWEARACKDDWEYRDASALWEKSAEGRTLVDEDGEEWEEDDIPLSLPFTELAFEWCRASCEGRYYYDGRAKTIFFERYHDLFHCRLATAGMPE